MASKEFTGKMIAAALLSVELGLVGCGSDSGRIAPTRQQSVADVLQERTGEEASNAADATGTFVEGDNPTYDEVDFDLTDMSSDMVYATVYDMVSNPSSYEGKVVRMGGPFYHTFYDETSQDYYFVVIQDATACCAQGLEFVWGDGTHAWPQDYPKEETEVVVTGVFQTYKEGKSTYAHLVDASLEVA